MAKVVEGEKDGIAIQRRLGVLLAHVVQDLGDEIELMAEVKDLTIGLFPGLVVVHGKGVIALI